MSLIELLKTTTDKSASKQDSLEDYDDKKASKDNVIQSYDSGEAVQPWKQWTRPRRRRRRKHNNQNRLSSDLSDTRLKGDSGELDSVVQLGSLKSPIISDQADRLASDPDSGGGVQLSRQGRQWGGGGGGYNPYYNPYAASSNNLGSFSNLYGSFRD